ncbi:hypothetical protein QQG55_25095 [Brugia pahangi]
MKVEGAGAVQDFRILELVKLKSNDLNGWCCDSVSVQHITDTGEGHQFACSISNRIKAFILSRSLVSFKAFKNISEIPELKSNTVNDNAQLLTVLQVSSAR